MANRLDRITTRSRTYDQISKEIRESIPELAPNWTSHGSDEPGIAILDILAGVSDALFFYIDRQARESFLSTAVLPESVHRLAHMLFYRPKRWYAAQGNIVLQIQRADENNSAFRENGFFLPALTQLKSEGGFDIITLEPVNIPPDFVGQDSISVLQGTYKTFTFTMTPENFSGVLLPAENIAEQLFEVFVDGEKWFDAYNYPLDSNINKFYYVTRSSKGRYMLSFRQTRGKVPPYGSTIEVRYLATDAQSYPANLIRTEAATLPENISWNHTDLTNASLPETLEQIADRAPASLNTSDRAVTRNDYKQLAKQLPNVKDIYVRKNKIGWNTVEIFVATQDGDAPSVELLTLVREFFQERNNLITSVRTYPAIFRRFVLSITVKPLPEFNPLPVVESVRRELNEFLSYKNMNFGKAIRISDVYALVESVRGVDYSNLVALHWLGNNPEVKNLVPFVTEVPILDRLTVSLE